MVDYSKFNTIEASDSDDEKQTVDPDKAEAWLRKANARHFQIRVSRAAHCCARLSSHDVGLV